MPSIIERLRAIFLLVAGIVVIASKPGHESRSKIEAPKMKRPTESAAPVVKPLARALRRAA